MSTPAVTETKPGVKTTEFWANIVVALLDVVTQIPIQDKAVLSGIAAAYAIARGIAKSGVPAVK